MTIRSHQTLVFEGAIEGIDELDAAGPAPARMVHGVEVLHFHAVEARWLRAA